MSRCSSQDYRGNAQRWADSINQSSAETLNLRLIEYQDHLDGGFIAWTVVFTDLVRHRRMIAMIYSGALSQLAVYPVCKAFEVDQLTEGKLVGEEYPSGIVLGLVKAAIRR
jgi:hypothetical protein